MDLQILTCTKNFKTSNNVRFKAGQQYKITPVNFQIGGTQIFRVTHDSGLSFCTIPSIINKFFIVAQ